jgi:hypothetical protein
VGSKPLDFFYFLIFHYFTAEPQRLPGLKIYYLATLVLTLTKWKCEGLLRGHGRWEDSCEESSVWTRDQSMPVHAIHQNRGRFEHSNESYLYVHACMYACMYGKCFLLCFTVSSLKLNIWILRGLCKQKYVCRCVNTTSWQYITSNIFGDNILKLFSL